MITLASPEHASARRRAVADPARRLEVERRAGERLGRSPYLAVRSIVCRMTRDGLRLDGTLPTFFLKQMAQEAVLDVEEIGRLDNRIVVDRRGARRPLVPAFGDGASLDAPAPASDSKHQEVTPCWS